MSLRTLFPAVLCGGLALPAAPPVVPVYAGAPAAAGAADGQGATAGFSNPVGMAVDPSGNVYVADSNNHVLRRIAPGGKVATLAGGGGQPYRDGTGAAATFSGLWGVAFARAAGTVYVTDVGGSTIRKITPAGVVTTLAGAPGASGSADGTGAGAAFRQPTGLAVDAAGTLFVADTGNHTIRKVTPGGAVTTLAGTAGTAGHADGPGAAATFRRPMGLALDGSGNLFVADFGNGAVRRITPLGQVTTLAVRDGKGAPVRFVTPAGLAADGAGNLYLADSFAGMVLKITAEGVVSTLVGVEGMDAAMVFPGTSGLPDGVALDPASGSLFITFGNAVLKTNESSNSTPVLQMPKKAAGLESFYFFLGNLPRGGRILNAERVICKSHPCALAQECPVGSRTNGRPEPQNSGEDPKAPDPGGLPVWPMPVTL